MDFREFLRQGFVVLDGATGSNLQQAGMESGDCPEQWIAEHPEVFIDLQCRYIEAGSDVLYTPTFTCNRIKLDEYGLASKQEELTKTLVGLTKEAIRRSKNRPQNLCCRRYFHDRAAVRANWKYAVRRTGRCL